MQGPLVQRTARPAPHCAGYLQHPRGTKPPLSRPKGNTCLVQSCFQLHRRSRLRLALPIHPVTLKATLAPYPKLHRSRPQRVALAETHPATVIPACRLPPHHLLIRAVDQRALGGPAACNQVRDIAFSHRERDTLAREHPAVTTIGTLCARCGEEPRLGESDNEATPWADVVATEPSNSNCAGMAPLAPLCPAHGKPAVDSNRAGAGLHL